jgi:hypothetical protein
MKKILFGAATLTLLAAAPAMANTSYRYFGFDNVDCFVTYENGVMKSWVCQDYGGFWVFRKEY